MAREKRDPRLELPPLELECMKALWSLGEGTVHGVREQLLAERPLAYTTVMTIMNRLAQKGAAQRIKRNRSFIYRPLISQSQVRRQAVGRLLSEHFDGSEEGLRSYLGQKTTEPAEALPPGLASPSAPARRAESLAPSPKPPISSPQPTGISAPKSETQSEPEIDEALL